MNFLLWHIILDFLRFLLLFHLYRSFSSWFLINCVKGKTVQGFPSFLVQFLLFLCERIYRLLGIVLAFFFEPILVDLRFRTNLIVFKSLSPLCTVLFTINSIFICNVISVSLSDIEPVDRILIFSKSMFSVVENVTEFFEVISNHDYQNYYD